MKQLIVQLYDCCFKKKYENVCSFIIMCWHVVKVVIKEKVLELLLYFTKHEDEEVKTKAIIGLGKNIMCFFFNVIRLTPGPTVSFYQLIGL